MNKQVRNMVVMCGVCVLAFGVYGISYEIQDKGNTEKSLAEGTEDETDRLFDISPEDVTAISYTYNGNETIALSLENGWKYTPDDTFPLNNNMAEDMASALAAGTVTQIIDSEQVDLLAFGLEDPTLSITFTEGENNVHSVAFGNLNATVSAYYTQIDQDNKVYMVSANMVTPFQYELYDLLVVDTIPSVEADYVSGFEVSYEENVYTYAYSVEEAETTTSEESSEIIWYESVNDGARKQCDSSEIATYVDYILNITSEEVVDYNAGSKEVLESDYGIGDNYILVNYVDANTDEELSYQLHFGNTDENGNMYFTLGDSYMVQSVSGDTMAKILK